MEVGLLVAIIAGILIPIVIGAWTYHNYLNTKFDKVGEGFKTVFRRMDETREKAAKEFVREDIYRENLVHYQEKVDQRFQSNMELITEKFKSVVSAIDRMDQTIKEKLNQGGKQ